MAGMWFEEFEAGQVVRHAMTRTVTEADNVLFTTLTMNPQPLHLDEEFAKGTEFGTRLVNSLFTLGLVVGLSVHELTMGTTVANLGFGSIEFPHPVRHGDTIRVETEVISVRPSQSRPGQGIVELEHRGFNQDEVVVVVARRSALMQGRPAEAG
jgi:acyl dehydratase